MPGRGCVSTLALIHLLRPPLKKGMKNAESFGTRRWFGGSDGLWLRIMSGEAVRIPLDDLTAPLAKPTRPSKLTLEQSKEIAELAASGASLRELASRFDVSHETVRKAISRAS